jgi:hypothetical protein
MAALGTFYPYLDDAVTDMRAAKSVDVEYCSSDISTTEFVAMQAVRPPCIYSVPLFVYTCLSRDLTQLEASYPSAS